MQPANRHRMCHSATNRPPQACLQRGFSPSCPSLGPAHLPWALLCQSGYWLGPAWSGELSS